MLKIFLTCVNDFFTKKFISLSLLPFLISSALFVGLIFGLGDNLADSLQGWMLEINFISNSDFWREIFSGDVTGGIFSVLIYGFGTFLALMGGVICATVISGFFTPTVAKYVNDKYYHAQTSPEVSNLKIFRIYAIFCAKFVLIFILGLLLLFVPIINIFAMNIAFFYLFYEFMLTDVASVCANEKRFELIMAKGGDMSFKIAALVFYLACLIPFVGLFFQLFFIMFFSHLILKKNAGVL